MMRMLGIFAFGVVLLSPCGVSQDKPSTDEKKVAAPEEKKATAPSEKPVRWLAITNGEIWPVSGPNIQRGTVLVKDDKIVQVGIDVKVPSGATVIDASGRHVVPGFVAIAARGCLGVRGNTMKEKAKDRFDPFADFMLMALGSGITTAHEGPGGRNEMFGGILGDGGGAFAGSPRGQVGGVIAKLTYGTTEGFELRDPAGVYMTYPLQSASQVLELRESFTKARDLQKKRREWMKALQEGKKDASEPKGDETQAALVRCLEGELPLFIYADTRLAILRTLEVSDEFKAPMVIHGAMEAWTATADIGRRSVALVLCPRGTGGRASRPYRSEHRDAPHGWTIANAKRCSDAGINWGTMTLTTSITTSLFGGRDLLGLAHEAAFAVRGGVTNAEALRSITLSAAEILKIDDRVGSLDVGKDADILVMDREPLDYRAFVELAFVNGKLTYERAKVPYWNHIPTDRSKAPENWVPYGIWGELKAPEQKSAK